MADASGNGNVTAGEPSGQDSRRPSADASDQAIESDDDSETGDELYRYEWGGALAAALGTFLTPVLTALPVAYCIYQLYPERLRGATVIMAVYFMTALIWAVFLFS